MVKEVDLAQLWDELGLTRAEVDAYGFLLKNGAATAGAVAKATRSSRGRTYQTLRTLVERGLAREQPVEPVEYVPVPPAEIARLLVLASQRRVVQLQALQEQAERLVPPTPPVAGPSQDSRASVFRGRRPVAAEMLRIVDAATKRVWLAGTAGFVRRLQNQKGLLSALQTKADAGVDVALAFAAEAGPGPDETVTGFRGVRVASLAWTQGLAVNLLVADSSALLIAPQPDDESPTQGDDYAVRLDGDAFSQSVLNWISALVRGGEPGIAAGASVAESRKRVLDSIASASSDVRIMGPAAWLQSLEEEDKLRNACEAARGRGLSVRVVTELDPVLWTWLQPILGEVEVRASRALPVSAVLIDEAQFFVGLQTGDGYVVRASQDPFEARHLDSLFARFWEQGVPLAS